MISQPKKTKQHDDHIPSVKDSDKPIVDMLTLRRDLYLVMSLLLADKEVAKIENVSDWTQDFHENEVRRLMLWVAAAARSLLDFLEEKDDSFSEQVCGEYWADFENGGEESLSFRQACNSAIHAEEIVSYILPTYVPEKSYSAAEKSGKSVRLVYDGRITIRSTHREMTTRAQLDIIQFVQIANALINSFGRNHNHANR